MPVFYLMDLTDESPLDLELFTEKTNIRIFSSDFLSTSDDLMEHRGEFFEKPKRFYEQIRSHSFEISDDGAHVWSGVLVLDILRFVAIGSVLFFEFRYFPEEFLFEAKAFESSRLFGSWRYRRMFAEEIRCTDAGL